MSLIEPTVFRESSFGDAPSPGADVLDRARHVAEIAARDAERVDHDSAFPAAAIAAAKQQNLLSLMVPTAFGGAEATLSMIADVCYILGQACASTAMIFAMHQAALACVVRHHQGEPWHSELLRRVARENLLLASSTTEGAAGGNVRSSVAPLVRIDDAISLDRAASVISYGAQADGIVTTARRDSDSTASTQALVVFLREDYTLEPTGGWQTLGMRGTCSSGFALKASGRAAQILPIGYDKIHPQTMVPVSHIVWAAVWTGIAAGAVSRAQNFIRVAARRAGGQMPPGATRYTQAAAMLRSLRADVRAALADYDGMLNDPVKLSALESQAGFNLLKVEVSEKAVETVSTAMRACGLAGYRNDGDFTVGRHLRDILSAPIMVHNDRIMANIATTTLMGGVPTELRG